MLSDELTVSRRHILEQHIATCRRCFIRHDEMENAFALVNAYSAQISAADLARTPERRDLLHVRLNRFYQADTASQPEVLSKRKGSLRITFPAMNPIFATAIVLFVASVVCLGAWLQQNKPALTSNALLVHAEAWDASSADPSAGVIYQKVGIKAARQRVYRTIYRDAGGKRQLKPEILAFEQEKLKTSLATAGVSWEAPLSATAYQNWHDRQRVRQDQIQRSGKNLVLKTTVPDGFIAEQTFTVRGSDFHPVERTVVFRDQETIEIAELEYQALPWTESIATLFESPGTLRNDVPLRLQPELVLRVPSFPTESQLDEAELSARLVLNETHADTGEQIRVDRQASGIQVKGLVETERRKEELKGQLRLIPHVVVALLSVEELNRQPGGTGGAEDTFVASLANKPSPLESYFVAQGKGTGSLSDVSSQLMDHAVRVDQESRSITELLSRFSSTDKMTDLAAATLSELLFAHRETLSRVMQQQRDLLRNLGGARSDSVSREGKQIALVTAAERQLALTKELTLGSGSPGRSAEAILNDLNFVAAEVSDAVQQARLKPQSTTAANGSK